ncbi:Wzz/FepE/Etk N-terminal domain-containing protein [Fodinibius salsisoli]|uniref:Wzz/FepE/Etk N-terminal domain-containing protein n=1 Tax=Fodinibius salsisoli TaxID=2820877 RepID=UPI0022458584
MDLVELFQTFWSERILIAKIVGAFLVLGLLVALLSPKEYSTSATLMPEAQSSQGAASSLLNQYGGLLGIGGGAASAGQEGTIPPQLYPNVVESLPFQVELMNTPVRFASYDTTATPHLFFSEVRSPSILSYLNPLKILGLFRGEEEEGPVITKVDRDSVLHLSKEQMETVKKMRQRLSVGVDQETGVISVSSEFPDPQAAAEVGQAGIKLLKEYMREYRTQKATKDLEFVEEQVEKARERFEEAQDKLAQFRDNNLSLATAKAQTREQELQSQYDLAFNLYNSLNQQLQQARLQLQEQTPVFSVLQPVSVPLNDNTSGFLILMVSGILGGIIALGWVLVQSWWQNAQIDWQD